MYLQLKWLAAAVCALLFTLFRIPVAHAQISFPLPAHATPANITAVEYFFDTDPGLGNGIALPMSAGVDVTATASINISGVTPGVHNFYTRARSAAGWSQATRSILYVIPTLSINAAASLKDIVALEYFIDTDPGIGNGNSIPFTPAPEVAINNLSANIGTLSDGVHRFFIRAKDAGGNWSLLNLFRMSIVTNTISIPAHAAPGNLTALEYFFDADPGFGNATRLTIPAGTDLQQYQFAADVSGLTDGTHTLYIRSVGNWSMTSSRTFRISNNPLPVRLVHFNAQKQGTFVALSWQTAIEEANSHFIIQRSSDAKTFDSIGTVAGKGTTSLANSYKFPDRQPLSGIGYYRLQQVDENGSFTYSPIIAVRMDAANDFFTINNPVTSSLHIHTLVGDSPLTYVITDLAGRNLMTVSGRKGEVAVVNTASFPAGVYLIRGYKGNEMHQLKFIKQ